MLWHCQYHLVWTQKYRYRVLSGSVNKEVRIWVGSGFLNVWSDAILPALYATGISKGLETDGCKTNSSPKFGYFEVAFNARIMVSGDENKALQDMI